MIRQSISCDVCGMEKKQTNHWFVAREHGGELHLGAWGARSRARAGVKHLCGQTCLHKLVDEFIARLLAMRSPAATESEAATDASLTTLAAYRRGDVAAGPGAPKRPPATAGPVAVPAAAQMPFPDEPPSYASRAWRAEAWEREREREHRPGFTPRRQSKG